MDIYTDGGCLNNSTINKIGGFAFVAVENNHLIHQYNQKVSHTTNNRMELQAIVHALLWLLNNNFSQTSSIIFSDSQYCVEGCEKWLKNWNKYDFAKKGNKELLNQDLWIILNSLIKYLPNIKFKWVKSHSNNIFNNLADELASKAMGSNSLFN